jgi:branched-chain amino acid transport system ATP-binding protein
MCGRRLLLLDEPFEGVAPALARRLVEAIAALRATGVSVLLSPPQVVAAKEARPSSSPWRRRSGWR